MASTNLIASLSKSTTMVSIKPVKYRCTTSAGMATMSPAAVVNKASDIPPASALALPVPTVVICAKTSIIPTTVPKRPNSGAMAATVPSELRYFSRSWTTCDAASIAQQVGPDRIGNRYNVFEHWALDEGASGIIWIGQRNQLGFRCH